MATATNRKETADDSTFHDFIGRPGAIELKARIEAYWRARGYDIQVMLLDGAFVQALRTTRVDVRSNLVNGLPRTASAGGINGSLPSEQPE